MRKIIFWANVLITVSVVGFIIVFQQLAKIELYGSGSILAEWSNNLARLLGYATTDDARAWLIFFEQAQSIVREYGLLLILLVSTNGLVTSFVVRKYMRTSTKQQADVLDEAIIQELEEAVANPPKPSEEKSRALKLVPTATKPTESFWEKLSREKEEGAERARERAALKEKHDDLKEKRATLARIQRQYEKDKKGSMFKEFPDTEKQISGLKAEIEALEKELFPNEAISA